MLDTPRHPNYNAAIPPLDMDTVASKHPAALEAAAKITSVILHEGTPELAKAVVQMEGQLSPAEQRATQQMVGAAVRHEVAADGKILSQIATTSPCTGKRT